ncbi:hypothetical protein [Butyrivibrio fibrisolvens]|uniref:hypothetical protein n=1 Tax=Butyrivibrio fibrisolvens TaxID=831 RepID=UPI00048072DB|nr:hypothetical protein [Butyrivibrio fibrisolvens]
MGRGKGGYTSIQVNYKDSGGRKVTDSGTIFVAERYIDMGYEAVFRQRHDEINAKTYDLSIKTCNDEHFIKNIEVKQTTSNNPSQLAKNIKEGFQQVGSDGTVALYLPGKSSNSQATKDFITSGYNEALRKNHVKGNVEVWFDDKTRITLNGGYYGKIRL